MDKPPAVRDDIIRFVIEHTEEVVARFFPDWEVPVYFAGHRSTMSDRVDLAYLLTHLKALGISAVHGHEIDAVIPRLLSQLRGVDVVHFYSYRTSEVLQGLGGLDAALEAGRRLGIGGGLNRENLLAAIDSTSMYNPATDTLPNYPNNYWAVLARCEFRRQELGLLPDPTILGTCLCHVNEILSLNTTGFFDDSVEANGRFDIYSPDVHLFLEPLWPMLDQKMLDRNLRAQVRLLESIAMENGAMVAWGRSIGALSVCLTMELGTLSLTHGYAADPARTLALVENAFTQFRGWIQDGLISAHRGRMTDAYRAVHRIMQMTLDCLCKICYTAKLLGEARVPEPAAAPPEPRELFPPRDEFTNFQEDGRAGLWMFRNAHLRFQFPLVSARNSDYVAWLHAPGLFCNPVDSQMICGAPRVAFGDRDCYPNGLPDMVEKRPNGLKARFTQWGPEPAQAVRELDLSVEGDTITGRERWSFEKLPDGITFDIPEGATPLHLEVECSTPHWLATLETEGLAEWRSAWEVLRRLHQTRITPAHEIEFTWKLRPAPRVCVHNLAHDYHTALYSARPARSLEVTDFGGNPNLHEPLAAHLGEADILHIGWPEHFFQARGLPEEVFDEKVHAYIAEMAASPVKVVWTMHNRRPHSVIRGERADRLYRAFAAIADGVIHHTEWGRDLMLAELPYKPSALHTVIPHGHFGEQMRTRQTRAELEAQYGIAPTAIRFGVLGRPQKEKQVELIAQAFMKAARPDQQLVITAHPFDLDVSGDPRIILIPREAWLTRETIAGHVKLCDALVSAHTGDTYLTSGTTADSIGAGIPTLTNDWGYMRETLGDTAIYHDNTVDGLAAVFAAISPERIAQGKAETEALKPRFEWKRIAEQTAEFMRQVRLAPERTGDL